MSGRMILIRQVGSVLNRQTRRFFLARGTGVGPAGADGVAPTAANVGTVITGAGAKATLADADLLGVSNSAAGGILVKWTYANLKAQLLAYLRAAFDSVFQPISAALSKITESAGLPLWDGGAWPGGGGGGGTETPITTLDLTAWGSHEIDTDLAAAGYADTYDELLYVFEDVKTTALGSPLYWQASNDGFATLLNCGSHSPEHYTSSTTIQHTIANNTPLALIMRWFDGNQAATLNGRFRIGGFNSAAYPHVMAQMNQASTDATRFKFEYNGGGVFTTGGLTGLRFTTNNAAIDWISGKIHILGVNYGA